MIAMLTPSLAPLVLLYGLVLRRHSKGAKDVFIPSFLLLSGYLTVWLMFAVIATAFQQALQPVGLLSEMMLWSRSDGFFASLLAAAGFYQFSPTFFMRTKSALLRAGFACRATLFRGAFDSLSYPR